MKRILVILCSWVMAMSLIMPIQASDSIDRAEVTVQWSENTSIGFLFGYAIKNPSSTQVLENQTVKVTGRDAEGHVIFVDERTFYRINPEEELWYGSSQVVDQDDITIEITCKKASSRKKTKKDKTQSQLFKLSNVEFTDDIQYNVTGQLSVSKNTEAYSKGTISCWATLVLKNGEDIVYIHSSSVLGYKNDNLDEIHVGDKDITVNTSFVKPRSITETDIVYDSYEIYVWNWYST